MAGRRKISFRRVGRSRQVRIDTADDLKFIPPLDEVYWAATGAPLASLNCDTTFLSMVDTDRNGRIMCFEIKGAVEWLLSVLSNTDGVTSSQTSLKLDAINTSDDYSRRIAATSEGILQALGAAGSDTITLDQVRQAKTLPTDAPPPEGAIAMSDAAELLQNASLAGKIDQYFKQCQAAGFDERLAERLGKGHGNAESLDLSDERAIDEFLRNSPLTKPQADMRLNFDSRINPHYSAELTKLKREVIEPILGQTIQKISAAQWDTIKHFFAAYQQGLDAQSAKVTLDEYLKTQNQSAAGPPNNKATLQGDDIVLVEKLILYQAYMLRLANNFVSFPYLYDPADRAMFEMGSLVMDSRRFNFCVKVTDRAAHSAVAKNGGIFVMYVEVYPTAGEKFELAVPVTSGTRQNLFVGKRCLFRGVDGAESDARVVQIIENPISIGEALVSPLRRTGKMIGGKIESLTSSGQKKLDSAAGGAIGSLSKSTPQAVPAKSQAPGGLMIGGMVMGGSVALAALGSAAAYVSKSLEGVDAYQVIAVLVAAVLAVMLPTAVIGLLKLRKRDLSAILEGSGWALNARMRLTLRQGRFFTCRR